MSTMKNTLPFLPGNSFRDPTQTSFPRSQSLTVRSDQNGSILDPDPAGSRKSSAVTKRVSSEVEARKPAWIQFDKVCLRFNAYFQESVVERQDENYRVRTCKILFYPEDDSVQVNEDKVENSGMRQGTLIRRCKIPKSGQNLERTMDVADGDDYFKVTDFNVGGEVMLYGKTFKITDCDGFTRKFLTNLGIIVNDPEDTPTNPQTELSKTSRMMETNAARPYEVHDTLRQYLDYDRKVLRFYVFWDDTSSMFGDQRFMIMHYYLADDTVELVEVLPANSGRSGNGIFFRRNKLPKEADSLVKLPGVQTARTVLNVHGQPIGKNRHLLDSLRTGAPEDEFYSDADFQIGTTFEVLGRHFLVCDCDEFTKEHYKNKFGTNMAEAIDVTEKTSDAPPPQAPPPTGFGTEEDSMVSVQRLVLQAPKKPAGKYMPKVASATDGSYVLRFSATFKDQSDLNQGREFILMYYVEDDTISVYEKGTRNSGIKAGKFLQRGKYIAPDGTRRLSLEDFSTEPGHEIEINRYAFIIQEADAYAKEFMAQNLN